MSEEGGGASSTTEVASGSSTGTDVALREYLSIIVAALDRRTHELRDADHRFQEERDRRYNEVNIEREKALKIKETADLAALGLAREIQAYKDEKANELRSQIESERGIYLRRDEYVSAHQGLIEKMDDNFKPLNDFMLSVQGAREQTSENREAGGYRIALFGVLGVSIVITLSVLGFTLSRTGNTSPVVVTTTVTQTVPSTTP